MKKGLLSLALMCFLFMSCNKDISGIYKSVNPDGFERDEIIIGSDSLQRVLYGNARESYQYSKQYIVCSFPYKIVIDCNLSSEKGKYTALIKDFNVIINPDEFKASALLADKPKISNDSLINHYKRYALETFKESLPKEGSPGYQFIINGNKLILVGGNEENDYYIKLVE